MRRAVWDLRALQSQQDMGSWRGKENEIKDCLCICQILVLFCLQFVPALLLMAVVCTDLLISPILCSNVDGDQWRQRDREKGDETLLSAQMHTYTQAQRSAVLVAPLVFSLHTNPRQQWRQSAIHIV